MLKVMQTGFKALALLKEQVIKYIAATFNK
jgi:hypothetical protein